MTVLLAALLLPCSLAVGQIRDQVVVTSADSGGFVPVLRRFDRRLNLLGSTSLVSETSNPISETITSIAIIGTGDIWIPIDPLNKKKLVRMDREGNPLPTVVLGDHPVAITSTTSMVYALTRIPLLTPAPLYAVDWTGSLLWSNPTGPLSYTGLFPRYPAVDTEGILWIGDATTGACACQSYYPELTRLAPASGDVLGKIALPATGAPQATSLGHLAGAPDGTIWALVQGPGWFLYNTDSSGILKSLDIPSGYNGVTNQIRVDAAGDVWGVGSSVESGGSLLRRYDKSDGSVLSQISVLERIKGFALGASGEDMFVVTADLSPRLYRLVRVNLISGKWSARSLDPWDRNALGNGDPTGFIYANVVDQAGDNDGDGATNREETLAGSSPYDPLSRPEGPKAYVTFAASNNAIILELRDPDGILDPGGGLDLATLSVKIGSYGEVFPYLLPFLTFVQFSADQTSVTAFFGALPLATGAKLTVDVQVADQTGAVGWDWQVTPPGEL